MQVNQFKIPRSRVEPAMASLAAIEGATNFYKSNQVDPPEGMATERVAALLITMEQQGLLENTRISARLGFDQLVGLGYVHDKSPRPHNGNWDRVTFTGKGGVTTRDDLLENEIKAFSDLLGQNWEILQGVKDSKKGVRIDGQKVDDKTLLTLSGVKGVSWVTDYSENGSPASMLEEIPTAILQVLKGKSPREVLAYHIEMSEVDIDEVAERVAPMMERHGLPVSFEKMVGMGLIAKETSRPASLEDYADVPVTINGQRMSLDELRYDEEFRHEVVSLFVKEIQDDLKFSWNGSEHVSAQEALEFASVRGVSNALRISTEGPDQDDLEFMDRTNDDVSRHMSMRM